jgi:hypothetical protein
MDKSNINIYQENNFSISGEYSIEIIKADGSIEKPFGDFKYKNLILDTFFNSILGGYKPGIQAFIQTCRLGSSSAAVSRSQTGLQGTQLSETNASSYFDLSVNESTNTISMSRDFLFPTVTSETTYREAVVGSFGVPNIENITTSRFTFPAEIVILSGDRLKLIYTLNIKLNYIFNDYPITLVKDSLNFSGKIRMSANSTGIFSIISGQNTIIPLGDTTEYVYRNYTVNSLTSLKTSAGHQSVGAYQNIFGIPTWSNKVGFFSGGHVPLNYPSGKAAYTPMGALGQMTRSNIQLSTLSGSVDMEYSFPQFQGDRQVGGLYLWYYDNPNSHSAIYYQFNNTQTIPALVPITLKLKWVFTRG